MSRQPSLSTQIFKGIAIFTPGGDLAYCVDPSKGERWHIQLCVLLQEALNLAEPPHFLTPCYSATLDKWRDSNTKELVITAEASPLVIRHQAVLNAVFDTVNLEWVPLSLPSETCNPLYLQHFRQKFPQLWETHDLMIPLTESAKHQSQISTRPLSDELLWSRSHQSIDSEGYILRLFMSGHGAGNERILKRLHTMLEMAMTKPYTLKVIDVFKNPDLAEADQISATPTLVRAWPLPVKKVVGDFQDINTLLGLLL